MYFSHMLRYYWENVQRENEAMNVAYSVQPQGVSTTQHDHDFYEVFLVDSGKGTHDFGKTSSKKIVQAGQAVFIRPWDRHGFTAMPSRESFALINVAFSAQAWKELREKYGAFGEPLFDEQNKNPPEMQWTGESHQRVVQLFRDLLVAPRTAISRDAFLLSLARLVEGKGEEPLPAGIPTWLRRSLFQFREEPDFPTCGVRRLVQLAGCSGGHLSRVMGEHLGCTPATWLKMERLKRAKRLLSTGDLSVSDVAALSGFENLSHFHRTFRQETGQTPRTYRNDQQRIPV